jgi:hypothetical protein
MGAESHKEKCQNIHDGRGCPAFSQIMGDSQDLEDAQRNCQPEDYAAHCCALSGMGKKKSDAWRKKADQGHTQGNQKEQGKHNERDRRFIHIVLRKMEIPTSAGRRAHRTAARASPRSLIEHFHFENTLSADSASVVSAHEE